jgi:iron complex transport system substrate-binding protein
MYSTNKIRFLLTSLLFMMVLIIAGCGSEDENGSKSGTTDNEDAAVTLDSEMGEVTIPAGVEKIVAPYHEDALLALGVTPAAKWAIGESVQDYLEDQLKDVPKLEWNVPLEQVLSHSPDLIILEHGLDSYEGTYEDYKKIATTFVMTEEMTTEWRKQIEVFGKILNKEDKAEEVLNGYSEKVEAAKEELSSAIGEETVAVIWAVGNQFFMFEENRHSAEVLYSELGVKVPELVKSLGDAEMQWNPISLEKLSELDADHVFLLAAEGEQGIDTLNNSDVWQSTPAAQSNNVYILNDQSNWTNKGLIASEKTIEDILEYLDK